MEENELKIYVCTAGETNSLPAEFTKSEYQIFDNTQLPNQEFFNESAMIKQILDAPPNAEWIGTAHYRRHLQLPIDLSKACIYAHKEHSIGKNNYEDFARFHSAKILKKFIDSINDVFVQFWFKKYMEQSDAWTRNIFVMHRDRFAISFDAWFNSIWRAANAVLPDVIAANYGTYQKRMCGMLCERGIGAYIWQSNKGVNCPLTTYDITSPWQRGANEMQIYIGGKWA